MVGKNINLILKSFIAILVTMSGLTSGGTVEAASVKEDPGTPSYSTVTEVYDWGPAVSKLIVNLGTKVKNGAVGTDTFKVHVVRTDTRKDVTLPEGTREGDRTVTKVYVSDKNGNCADNGNYVTIEMKVGPVESLGYPIYYESKRYKSNAWVNCDYTITQQKDIPAVSGTLSGLKIKKKTADIKRYIDDFKTGSFTDSESNIKLTYASFTPAKDNVKNPLIIWLRGSGESGSDPLIPLLANKSCQFASPKIQKLFGGAYVLSPQCTTIWMEGSNEKALMALIKDFVSKNSDIDTNRIYLGGNSNGGYITMALLRDYPDYFTAAMPSSEAMPDRFITDSEIQSMKKIPIWFTVAKNDPDIPPDTYTIATYKRLIAAGAKNVHLSLYDNVVDTSGLYKKGDGSPFEYNGHFSYIYVLNDECTETIDGKKTANFEWWAMQTKAKVTPTTTQKTKTAQTSLTQKTAGSKKSLYIAVLAVVAVLAAAAIIIAVLKNKHA